MVVITSSYKLTSSVGLLCFHWTHTHAHNKHRLRLRLFIFCIHVGCVKSQHKDDRSPFKGAWSGSAGDRIVCKFVLLVYDWLLTVKRWRCVCIDTGEPKFESPEDKLQSTNITEGEQLRFPCRVTAEPVAQIVWLRNGEPLDRKSHFHRLFTLVFKIYWTWFNS